MEALKKETVPYRILVAEDSPTQRQIINTVLQQEGFEVMLASDGIEAVHKAYDECPDLLILDIDMPKMNGYQVCRLVRDDQRISHIPVIMLTGREQEKDKFWGLKTGADRYVTKGFQLEGLTSTIYDLLDQKGVTAGETRLGENGISLEMAGREMNVLTRVNDLLDRKLYEATVINEISKLNTICEESEVTISSALALIAKVTESFVCSIMLIEEGEMIIHVHNSVSSDYYKRSKNLAIEEARIYMSAPFNADSINVYRDDEESLTGEDVSASDEIHSILSLPLMARGKNIAILTINSPRADAFSDTVVKTLKILENPLSVVIDNARLYEGAKRMAITDGLTRLFNHRHFYELLEHEFKRTIRYMSKVSLIMADIDSFKMINDTYGHQVGDEILKKLAAMMSREVREVDILARYGGEEFAVMLPQTEIQQAGMVAERIRKAVEENPIDTEAGQIAVTISLGVAGFPESQVKSHTELVQMADKSLYKAKESGKNKVVVSK